METSVGASTVSVTEFVTDPDVAVMVELPGPPLDASPPVTLATRGFDEVQVAELVKSCVLPSLKVPVAVNCCVAPKAITGFTGVTAMDCSAAPAIVSVAEPLMPFWVAISVTLPCPTGVAKPAVGIELLIVATVPSPALQDAELVMF